MFEIDIACEMWFSAINICGSVYLHLLIAAGKRSLGQGNVFTGVCLSVHRGSLMSLPVWLPDPMFLKGGLCPWSHVPPGGSLPRGVFPPPHKSENRAVRILLECFLVFYSECLFGEIIDSPMTH